MGPRAGVWASTTPFFPWSSAAHCTPSRASPTRAAGCEPRQPPAWASRDAAASHCTSGLQHRGGRAPDTLKPGRCPSARSGEIRLLEGVFSRSVRSAPPPSAALPWHLQLLRATETTRGSPRGGIGPRDCQIRCPRRKPRRPLLVSSLTSSGATLCPASASREPPRGGTMAAPSGALNLPTRR